MQDFSKPEVPIYYSNNPLAKDCKNQRLRQNAANYEHEKRNAREQIIKNLIKNVSCDTQYIQHLKVLYDLEDEEDEEESVYGWEKHNHKTKNNSIFRTFLLIFLF